MSVACLDERSAADGFVLACRTYPITDLVLTCTPCEAPEVNESTDDR
jgi:hypothetical protein